MQEDGAPTVNSSTVTDWRELASRASKESDPQKLSELVQQLCNRLDQIEEEKKAAQRAGSATAGPNEHPKP
jgi:outer membrane murein-binding lipoprotein Lpp